MNNAPITGDKYQAQAQIGVTLHNMPVYPKEFLMDGGHPLNQSNLSGKRLGAVVLATGYAKPVLYTAAGSSPVDAWIAVTNDGTDITPSAPKASVTATPKKKSPQWYESDRQF